MYKKYVNIPQKYEKHTKYILIQIWKNYKSNMWKKYVKNIPKNM